MSTAWKVALSANFIVLAAVVALLGALLAGRGIWHHPDASALNDARSEATALRSQNRRLRHDLRTLEADVRELGQQTETGSLSQTDLKAVQYGVGQAEYFVGHYCQHFQNVFTTPGGATRLLVQAGLDACADWNGR